MRKTKFLLTLLVALSMFGFMGCEGGSSPRPGQTDDIDQLTPEARNALKQFLIVTPRGAARTSPPGFMPPDGFQAYVLMDEQLPIEIYDMVGIGDVPVVNATLVQVDPGAAGGDNLPAAAGAMAVSVDPATRRAIIAGRARNVDPTMLAQAFLQMFDIFIPPLDVVPVPSPGLLPPADPTSVLVFGGEAQFHNTKFHPNGSYVLQLIDRDGVNPGDLSVYLYNAATGDYQFSTTVNVGPAPREIAFARGGRFVYITNSGNATVSAFQVDTATGNLIPVIGSPYPLNAGEIPGDGLDNDGNGAVDDIVTGTWGVTVTRDGQFLYVASQSGHVNAFAINADGSLTPVSADGVTPAGLPVFVAGTPTGIATSPAADVLYMTDIAANGVFSFNVNPATGVLTPTPGVFENAGAGQANPANIKVDPTGRFVITANQAQDEDDQTAEDATGDGIIVVPDTVDTSAFYNGGISRFRILEDGSLSFEQSISTLNPYGIDFFQFIP